MTDGLGWNADVDSAMAAGDCDSSVVLSSDMHIYDLVEKIDAPQKYEALAMDLVGSMPEVSNLIGKTQISYEEVVFKCMLEWRNEHGSDDGKCRELTEILRECNLGAAASALEKNMQQERKCLSKDIVLMDLASGMDCVKCYKSLAFKLGFTHARLSNLIGIPVINPQYRDALFKAVIQWKNQHGDTVKSAKDLRKILKKHRLANAVDFWDSLEPGLVETKSEASTLMEDVQQGQHLELEAALHRSPPEGDSIKPTQSS